MLLELVNDSLTNNFSATKQEIFLLDHSFVLHFNLFNLFLAKVSFHASELGRHILNRAPLFFLSSIDNSVTQPSGTTLKISLVHNVHNVDLKLSTIVMWLFFYHPFLIFSAGDNINQRELDGIGSVETASNVLTTENFDSLPTIRDGLVTAVCNGTSLILFITHQ